MSGQVCKAALCAVVAATINTHVDLILGGHVSEEGIDEFIKMTEKMEEKSKKWQDKYIDFED